MNYIGPVIEHMQGHRQRDTVPTDSITRGSGSLQHSSVDYHTNGDELSNQAIQS